MPCLRHGLQIAVQGRATQPGVLILLARLITNCVALLAELLV
jgi:hypothetical protein